MSARTYRAVPRPAPRRRGTAGPATRIHWDRLGRVVLVIVLFAVLFSYIGPVVKFVGTWRSSGAEQARYQQLRREHGSLERRSAELARPAVLELEARRAGMIRQGERPYVVRGLRR